MNRSDIREQFVTQLTEHQNQLFGYVFSLLGDRSRAADVVQETNLVLWRKVDEYEPHRPFLPWAFSIARFQVLAHLRDQKRDRLLLDPELVETLSEAVEQRAGQMDGVRMALRRCLQGLAANNRQLIEQRYLRAMSLDDVAASTKRTVGAVKVALMRVRRHLAECVEKRLTAEA